MFDTQQKRVATLTDSLNYIQLSAPASRCFELLISHPDQLIDKGKLLDYGWRDHGIFVTDNSLNQAILSIRKALRNLGAEENFIITVPRIGYRINANYNITPIVDSGMVQPEALEFQPDESKREIVIEGTALSPPKSRKAQLNKVYACLLSVALSWALCVSLVVNNKILSNYHSISNQLTYTRIAEIYNGINLYIDSDYDINNTKMAAVIDKITHNGYLKDLIKKFGNINDIYINGSYTESVVSLFLCTQKIEVTDRPCYSYVLVELNR